jgi:hypothetical protein
MKYEIHKGVTKIKSKFQRIILGAVAVAFPAALVASGSAAAATPAFSLVPFEFVGTAAQCGGTAGTDTVTAEWDNSTGNPAPSILLQKLGATTNCASAGVDIISPLEGQAVSNLTELNFDYKTGEHCGAGAPRFNLQLDQAGNQNAFLGCAGGTQTPASNGYTHVEYSAAQIQAAVVAAGGTPTSTLQDLYIIFDEGSDTPTGGTIGTAGTIHIDNISVNNAVVGDPTSPTTKDQCKNGGYQNYTDDNGNPFRNQGQCVAFVNRGINTNRHTTNVRINNTNNVNVRQRNNQTATSGNATQSNNTNTGNATSGNASNSNSSTSTVNITNTNTPVTNTQ